MSRNPNKISKFILKLLEILNSQKYQSIIKWSSEGTRVQILNRKQLETKVLTCHFKLRKVTSFIRQLHLYGFYKSKGEKKANLFQHPLFVKNSAQDYCLIKRKYKDKQSECSREVIETESSEVKEVIKEKLLPQLFSIKSMENIFKGIQESRVCSNQVFFEEWYMNKEQDLSFFLEDCLN